MWAHSKKTKRNGFTIVELLIVIVVIAVLAAITIVAYNNIQDRARFASMQTDLKSITTALELYKAENGSYPNTIGQSGCTANWCGWDQSTGDNFITGLSPKYISKIPQLPAPYPNNNSYLYQSNGTDYALIRYNGVNAPAAGLTAVEYNSPLSIKTDGYDGLAWGYRTFTGAWW